MTLANAFNCGGETKTDCLSSINQSNNQSVGWLEFNIPFQHKYSYIRDENNQPIIYYGAPSQSDVQGRLTKNKLTKNTGFTSHSTRNRSFQRRSSQPICWVVLRKQPEMLAHAQRDGHPVKYRWRPLQKSCNCIPCSMPQSLDDARCWSATQ